MSNFDDKEQLIQTKEMPIVSFCVYCDKPIYVGEEYQEVEYYGNSESKRLCKKDLTKGFAHKHCVKEKEGLVEELKETDKKQRELSLVFAILGGVVLAAILMVIFILSKAMHLALAISIPLVAGYLLTSSIYVLLSHNKFGNFVKKAVAKLAKIPIDAYHLNFFIAIRILVIIAITPLGYVLMIILCLLSMIISMFVFPFLLINFKK